MFEPTSDFYVTEVLNETNEFTDSSTFGGLSADIIVAISATVTGVSIGVTAVLVGVRKIGKSARVPRLGYDLDVPEDHFEKEKEDVDDLKQRRPLEEDKEESLTEDEELEELEEYLSFGSEDDLLAAERKAERLDAEAMECVVAEGEVMPEDVIQVSVSEDVVGVDTGLGHGMESVVEDRDTVVEDLFAVFLQSQNHGPPT
jgi:hypothetical protein